MGHAYQRGSQNTDDESGYAARQTRTPPHAKAHKAVLPSTTATSTTPAERGDYLPHAAKAALLLLASAPPARTFELLEQENSKPAMPTATSATEAFTTTSTKKEI